MGKLQKVRLEDITVNWDKKRIPLSSAERANLEKKYRYYGAQGVIDYVDNYLFDGDYVLVAEDGENLRSQKNNICNYVTGKFWVNNHAHIIQAKENNDLKYIYYRLNLVDFRPYITGSAQPKLTQDNLNSIELTIHDFPTQQKIAAVLSALDAKIELNARINAELESMAKTLYDYWFVQFETPLPSPLKGGSQSAGGKMVWNEALKREIPLGWEVKSLSEITKVSTTTVNPMNYPQKQFKHYSIPAFDETGTYKIELGEEILSNKFTVQSSDVLVSKLNPWFSRVVYSTNDIDLICSSEFVVWRTENQSIKNFLYMVAKDLSFIDYCTRSASGTSHSHRRVNPQVMMKYQLAYNSEIASKFGTIINPMIETVAKNRVESQTLTELRDWLLPMLMNGQVKV
ncbi:MAG: restriction endonuclease subunit S [Anaerolineales bacterium]|nr:restriction endonuclease subunit S [Anaerolineales bacterium]